MRQSLKGKSLLGPSASCGSLLSLAQHWGQNEKQFRPGLDKAFLIEKEQTGTLTVDVRVCANLWVVLEQRLCIFAILGLLLSTDCASNLLAYCEHILCICATFWALCICKQGFGFVLIMAC